MLQSSPIEKRRIQSFDLTDSPMMVQGQMGGVKKAQVLKWEESGRSVKPYTLHARSKQYYLADGTLDSLQVETIREESTSDKHIKLAHILLCPWLYTDPMTNNIQNKVK
ncbi:unnamed protein product [Caenorhabditis brenneri]